MSAILRREAGAPILSLPKIKYIIYPIVTCIYLGRQFFKVIYFLNIVIMRLKDIPCVGTF